MILHLHTDSRFANYTIDVFGSKENYHLIGMRYPGQKLRFVTKQEHVGMYVFGWSQAKRQLTKLSPAMIVVHFMDIRWFELLSIIPENTTVVWIFWGGDGYSLPKMSEDLYDKYTSRRLKDQSTVSKLDKMKADLGIKSALSIPFITSLLFETLRKSKISKDSNQVREALFTRVNYCGTFLKEDYELLHSKYPFQMNWTDARFISLERLIGSIDAEPCSGNHILLGNSCTMENNHVDAIEVIRQLEIDEGQEVICPLSYGKDLGKYRDWVIEDGKKSLGESFKPLVELMPLNEYTRILRSCSFAIMYHNRQQAFNNILALIYLGVKVYLKPNNTIYSYLKRIGCNVFSTNKLNETKKLQPLSEVMADENRQVLRKEFSQEKIIESATGIMQLAKETSG
ncbi:TDP-N-acetylfucosamine:lipid II N-acetylfucosaminyltransferase [Ekhidna sp. To15]|uniref:TDP-N-acetylfucosamine:lipid II N-acetylfucosaminyltransferase n=1 Tax=Ekhidna sp. To15 TaxID=3395267 RepID=UPI003F525552